MRRRPLSGLALLLALAAWGRTARADGSTNSSTCGASKRPVVALRANELDEELRSAVTEQLRAALALRNLELCTNGGANAIAVVELSSQAASGVSVTLTLRDDVTDKRVSRDMDLRSIPSDARGLAITQGIDELLRASWAELLVEDSPRSVRGAPPEVVSAIPAPAAAAPRAASPVAEAGVAFAMEYFGGGHGQLGADVSFFVFPTRRLGFGGRGGPRFAPGVDGGIGVVRANGFSAGLTSSYALLPRDRSLGLDAGAELFLTHLQYRAVARGAAVANDDADTAVHVLATLRGSAVVTGPLRANLGFGLGAPIRGVRGLADDRTITAANGVVVSFQLGFGGGW